MRHIIGRVFLIALACWGLSQVVGCTKNTRATIITRVEAGAVSARRSNDRAAAQILKWNATALHVIEATATTEAELELRVAKLDQLRAPVEHAFAVVDAALTAVETLLPLVHEKQRDPVELLAAGAQLYEAAQKLLAELVALGVR